MSRLLLESWSVAQEFQVKIFGSLIVGWATIDCHKISPRSRH